MQHRAIPWVLLCRDLERACEGDKHLQKSKVEATFPIRFKKKSGWEERGV